jgi:hypothetical protein
VLKIVAFSDGFQSGNPAGVMLYVVLPNAATMQRGYGGVINVTQGKGMCAGATLHFLMPRKTAFTHSTTLRFILFNNSI